MGNTLYDVCNHCGHKSKIHFHVINERMVKAFMKLYKKSSYHKYFNRVKLRDLNLSISDNNNFQKLQHFGIVTRNKKGYKPTQLGVEFARGENYISSRVATLNNTRLMNDHWCWDKKEDKYKPRKVHITDLLPQEYRTREQYSKDSLLNKYFPDG